MDRARYTGTREELKVEVTADVMLSNQLVEISFDREIWYTAEWLGTASTTRVAKLLVGDSVELPTSTTHVWVRVTDGPERPVMDAGLLVIK